MSAILKRLGAPEKFKRMLAVHEYYQTHTGPTIRGAVEFIPESSALVQQYSKLRTETLRGGQDDITTEDIRRYVLGV